MSRLLPIDDCIHCNNFDEVISWCDRENRHITCIAGTHIEHHPIPYWCPLEEKKDSTPTGFSETDIPLVPTGWKEVKDD